MTTQDLSGSNTLLAARVQVPQSVVYRSFAHETVALNLETGQYHGVNPTGGRMLEVLAKLGSVAECAEVLAREYDAPVEHVRVDLCEFCEALIERGLLVVRDH